MKSNFTDSNVTHAEKATSDLQLLEEGGFQEDKSATYTTCI